MDNLSAVRNIRIEPGIVGSLQPPATSAAATKGSVRVCRRVHLFFCQEASQALDRAMVALCNSRRAHPHPLLPATRGISHAKLMARSICDSKSGVGSRKGKHRGITRFVGMLTDPCDSQLVGTDTIPRIGSLTHSPTHARHPQPMSL
jgi:hypothetical protein